VIKWVAITDKSIGISQLLGGTCLGCPPKATPMASLQETYSDALSGQLQLKNNDLRDI